MKKIFNIVVLMVCAISFSFAQSNVIIYASNNGSGNGQSVETPTSLQGAIDTIKNAVVNSATTYEVQLLSGEYTGSKIRIEQQTYKNVVIKPNNSDNCIMKVTFAIDGTSSSSSSESITFQGLQFENGRITGDTVNNGLGNDNDRAHCYPHNINIENCTFTNESSTTIENITSVSAYNWKISNCVFTSCERAIQNGGGANNFQVLNCTFSNCARGLNLRGEQIEISGCTFTGVTNYAIRLGQSSGTPKHEPQYAMHVIGCSISGSPEGEEQGLIVLRGDCGDMIIGNTTTVSATGENPVAFWVTDRGKVIVGAGDTLELTGNVNLQGSDAAFEGEDFSSHLTVSGTSNFKPAGDYCRVDSIWIGTDNWLYYGAQEENPLSFNENGICEISSAEQLARLSCEVLANKLPSYSGKRTFKVVSDINLNDHEWFPIGKHYHEFTDIFDGGNHTISNLHINQPEDSHLGLIGRCSNNAEIKNVVLNNVEITGYEYVAGICGETFVGQLFNNRVKGTVKLTGSHHVGGLAGYIYGNTYFCSVDGDDQSFVKGVANLEEWGYPVGGLIGFYGEDNYSIMNSSAKIDVQASGRVGGLIGYLNQNKKVVDCYHQGDVTYTDVNDSILRTKSGMGGIAGEALSNIKLVNCYHTGNITNKFLEYTQNAGSLVGKHENDINVTNCYYNSESTITNGTSSFGTGKSATEMKSAAMASTLGGAYLGEDGQFPVLLQIPQGEGTETDPYIIASDNDLAFVAVMSHTTDDNLKSFFHNAYYKQTENLTLKANDSITIQAGMTYTVDNGKTLTISGKIIDDANKLVGADATSQLTITEGAVYGTKSAGTYAWFVSQWVDPNSSWLYIGAQQPALTYTGGVCEINSAEQLARMSYEVNYDLLPERTSPITFKLTDDINLGGHEWCPIGTDDDNFIGFVDNFDGQGHTISDMTITDASPCLAIYGNALFGKITADTIENFKLANVKVYPNNYDRHSNTSLAAAGVAGVAMGATLRNIEIETGEIRTDYGSCVSGAVAYLSVYKDSNNIIHNSYMYNVVNRANLTDGSGLYKDYKDYAIIGGVAGLIANDYDFYSADNGQIIFEKCANYGQLQSVNPYQLLSDGKIADGKSYGYTIAGQIAGQCSHTANTYIVFDSCVTSGTIYGNKTLTCSGGALSENSGRCMFQGKKWTGINESVDNGYTSEDYYFGNEKVYFTAKNANEISEALKEENFIENDGIFDNSSKKPITEAEHQAIIATKSVVATAAGTGQTFVFRAAAMVGDKIYLNVDSAAKNNLPGTIVIIASDTCAEQTQWDANDTIQTIRNVKIVVPANATLTVNGTLELGNHAQCVGIDETSRIIVTRKCTDATETENINPGIYYWDASESKWGRVDAEEVVEEE